MYNLGCNLHESTLVANKMKEHWTESISYDESQLLEPVKPGHSAGPVLGVRDVGREAVHAQVPDRAATHQIIDVCEPERLKRQLMKPDPVDKKSDTLEDLADYGKQEERTATKLVREGPGEQGIDDSWHLEHDDQIIMLDGRVHL